MSETADRIAAVVRHFEHIERQHMRGLPILNTRLAVEAVAARDFGDHTVFILISPWFMNLVLLPGSDEWDDCEQGECIDIEFPYEALEFSVSHDDELGTFLSTVLFRTASEFPDQESASTVATEVMLTLFTTNTATADRPTSKRKNTLSRRSLLTVLGGT